MFGELVSIIKNWPQLPIPDKPMSIPCQERLRKALVDLANNQNSAGIGDIAGLIYHVLRRESLLAKRAILLTVPIHEKWPNEMTWRSFGLDIVLRGPTWYQLEATAWYPDWIGEALQTPPLDDAFIEVQRRTELSVPVDPFLPVELNPLFKRYSCRGQRMAVRTVLLSKKGDITVVNLPTGAGKSILTWVLAMAEQSMSGLTLVIVPTVALALDQERQAQDLFKNRLSSGIPLAWHAGLSADMRKAIKTHIYQGTQRVLFSSPESVIRSLSPVLYKAAQKGLLKGFIIDEAHLVSQWGAEFRPEFQALAGLISDLRKRCPSNMLFKTVLMTATLTSETYIALKSLYCQDKEPLLVSEARLRPEPTYYICNAYNHKEREKRVLELIRHLPRPFIFYVTSPEDTGYWRNLLLSQDIRRIDVLHGGSSSEKRKLVVDAWVRDEIDVVIATSAFGLGMDKDNVRAIVHACVPETVDRFYQEVGRAGRDGKACVSFIVYVNSDLDKAVSLNQRRIISIERGYDRWKAMFANRSDIQGERDLFRVNLQEKPSDIIQDSEENEAWNLRTLLLLVRARMIELESSPPPKVENIDDIDESTFEKQRSTVMQEYFKSRVVRVFAGHMDPLVWQEKAEEVRRQIRSADVKSIAQMKDILNKNREISDVLCEIYRISDAGVEVDPTCGGCPVCRKIGRQEISVSSGYLAPPNLQLEDVDPMLRRVIGPEINFLPVVYEHPGFSALAIRKWRRQIFSLLKRLISMGILEISTSDLWLNDQNYLDLYRYSPGGFVFHTSLEEHQGIAGEIQLPRCTLVDPEFENINLLKNLMLMERKLHLILIPEDIPNPIYPHRRLIDVNEHRYLKSFYGRLEQ